MDHPNFILVAYSVGVLVPLILAVSTWLRLARVTRRLSSVDPRRRHHRHEVESYDAQTP